MALTIATATGGVAPAAAPEQAASGSSNSQTSDAFAGVLAGVGESGARPGRQDAAEDRTGTRSHRAVTDAEADAQAAGLAAADLSAVDLAVLALLTPALPVSTGAPLNAQYRAAGEPSSDGSAPVDGTTAGAAATSAAPAGVPGSATGPAQAAGATQAALPAQAAKPAPPAQAVLPAQAAAQGSGQTKAAQAPADEADRQDELPDAGRPSGTVADQPIAQPAAVGATSQAPAATQASHAASRPAAGTAPTGAGFGAPAGATGSGAVDPTALAGMTTTVEQTVVSAAASALTPAFASIQKSDSATTAPGQAQSPKQPGPSDAAVAAAGTLPGTAAVVASTSGAVRASAGTHHRSAHGSAGEPTEPAAPATASIPVTTAIFDPAGPAGSAGTTASALGSAVQPAPAGAVAGQPVTTDRNAQPVHQHPAADQPVASQVAAPVLALRARGDGSHQLLVALHPADLGPVNVHVRIAGDAMTISLASTSETAHEALRDAMPQLRAELQSAGLSSASLSLDLTSGDAGAFADPRYADPGQADPRQSGGRQQASTAPVADQPFSPVRPRLSGARIGASSSSGLDRWL